jgi:pimeloyl-ACP methyl ester carboxylesterase
VKRSHDESGGSSAAAASSTESQVDELSHAPLAEELRVHLVGWSMGGMIGTHLATLIQAQHGVFPQSPFCSLCLASSSPGGWVVTHPFSTASSPPAAESISFDHLHASSSANSLDANSTPHPASQSLRERNIIFRLFSALFSWVPLPLPRNLPPWHGLLLCARSVLAIRTQTRIRRILELHHAPVFYDKVCLQSSSIFKSFRCFILIESLLFHFDFSSASTKKSLK